MMLSDHCLKFLSNSDSSCTLAPRRRRGHEADDAALRPKGSFSYLPGDPPWLRTTGDSDPDEPSSSVAKNHQVLEQGKKKKRKK